MVFPLKPQGVDFVLQYKLYVQYAENVFSFTEYLSSILCASILGILDDVIDTLFVQCVQTRKNKISVHTWIKVF